MPQLLPLIFSLHNISLIHKAHHGVPILILLVIKPHSFPYPGHLHYIVQSLTHVQGLTDWTQLDLVYLSLFRLLNEIEVVVHFKISNFASGVRVKLSVLKGFVGSIQISSHNVSLFIDLMLYPFFYNLKVLRKCELEHSPGYKRIQK